MDKRHQDEGIPPEKQQSLSPATNVDPEQDENKQSARARKDPAEEGRKTDKPRKNAGIRDSAEIPPDRYHNEKGL